MFVHDARINILGVLCLRFFLIFLEEWSGLLFNIFVVCSGCCLCFVCYAAVVVALEVMPLSGGGREVTASIIRFSRFWVLVVVVLFVFRCVLLCLFQM